MRILRVTSNSYFMFRCFYVSFFIFLSSFSLVAQKGTVLFFVSQDSVYYSEYIVAHQALIDAGYSVDVRSSSGTTAIPYMIPSGTTIVATANSLSGSSYSDFTTQYNALFGGAWNSSLNIIPSSITLNGRIQDVVNMNNYVGLVLAGGTGIKHYRVDGTYYGHGSSTSNDVQTAAEKLNALALDALKNEKPVLAQCHGASIPVFWRISGTTGSGAEAMGYSLVKGENAAGYPDAETASLYSDLNVQFLSNSKVIVCSPHSSLNSTEGNFKVLTSSDWYPQTVLFATKALINVLESFPSKVAREQNTSVLIIHGGAIDVNNCSAGNKANDVPCNYGQGNNLPADYTHLQNLLSANMNDGYNITISDLNLAGTLPFNSSNQSEILTYLNNYDAVIFFKHWSTFITDELLYAIKSYVDNGGGLLSLHHGMYNDNSVGQNIDILVNEVLGMSSEQNTWSAGLNTFSVINTNYGHFVSSYGINYNSVEGTPSTWSSVPSLTKSNLSFSNYPSFSIYDEIYNNMSFTGTPIFGNGVNEINPLFSNTSSSNNQIHTTGFTKLYNPSSDETVGRVVCLSQGERRESINQNHAYGQAIRNAVIWSANQTGTVTSDVQIAAVEHFDLYPNPTTSVLTVKVADEILEVFIRDASGAVKQVVLGKETAQLTIDLSHLSNGLYFVEVKSKNNKLVKKVLKL